MFLESGYFINMKINLKVSCWYSHWNFSSIEKNQLEDKNQQGIFRDIGSKYLDPLKLILKSHHHKTKIPHHPKFLAYFSDMRAGLSIRRENLLQLSKLKKWKSVLILLSARSLLNKDYWGLWTTLGELFSVPSAILIKIGFLKF